MRFTRFVQCCVSMGLLFTPALSYGQALTLEEPARVANPRREATTTQIPSSRQERKKWQARSVLLHLNAVPPAESGKETRRALLIKRWTELGRIESVETPKGQRKIELRTSSISQQRSLSIDLLDDRGAMLADVRAQVSLIKRDLSKLMLALRSREPEEKK